MTEKPDTPIRTAVLGFGLAGRVFHCPFISAVPGLELNSIVQRKGDEAAHAYPSARILRSVNEALADPTIDLIVVATPNETHFDLAAQALQAGKHVVVDKPITSSAKSAQALASLAKVHTRILAPFHNRRWDGDFLTVRKLLADNTLGRVVEIVSRFDRYRPLQRPNTWKESASASTGLLYDLGPHVIDQALALLGPPSRITADIRHDRDRTDIDDAFDVILHYDVNGRALRYGCHAAMLAADPSARFLVNGTHGSYRKFGVDPQEPTLLNTPRRPPRLGSPESETNPWLPEPESAWGTLTVAAGELSQNTELTHSKLPTIPGDYRQFYANVRDAILGKAPLAVTAEDGYRTLRLLDLARQSHQEGRTLPVIFD